MAQSVQINGLDALSEDFRRLAEEELPQMKRELHEALAGQIREEVVKSLGDRAKSNTGKIAGMQEKYVGSGGGYAAVRPQRGKNEKGYAYGYITNSLENGHAIRRSSGRWKGYRARIKKKYVLGIHFYERAGRAAEKLAIDGANRLADEIKQKLEK